MIINRKRPFPLDQVNGCHLHLENERALIENLDQLAVNNNQMEEHRLKLMETGNRQDNRNRRCECQ